MSIGNSSFKVPYDLRPCKQIERRMMLHSLQGLQEIGFPISKYQYTGFGSLFFVDYILIRKLLGIYDMVSVEINEEIESRVRYNVPHNDIKIEIGDVGDFIPCLSKDKQHLLWLDYDDVFQSFMADHLIEACSVLSAGSVIAITVDVDYKSLDDPTNAVWFNHFVDQAEDFLPPGVTKNQFDPEGISFMVSEVISAIMSKITYRKGMSFVPMFNFIYADGHEMQTLGGMICDTASKSRLKKYNWAQFPFLRKKLEQEPYRIKSPVLTRKERLYLDTHLPAEAGWKPDVFTLRDAQLEQYREVYKYCPMYAELLL